MHRMTADQLDSTIIHLFATEPRIGVLGASRRLGVARGTVQARLDRLERSGIIDGWGPDIDPASLGYEVSAFITLEIRQGVGHESVAEHLTAVSAVLEAHTITGTGDMLLRVVARDNPDLQRVIDEILGFDGILRTTTVIALCTQVRRRVLPLLDEAARRASYTARRE